jgi:hypothetical protein
VKNRYNLQTKLEQLLRGMKAPKLGPLPSVWTDQDLYEVAWIVQNFVNNTHEVIEDDNGLRDWLDEYKFYRSTFK